MKIAQEIHVLLEIRNYFSMKTKKGKLAIVSIDTVPVVLSLYLVSHVQADGKYSLTESTVYHIHYDRK